MICVHVKKLYQLCETEGLKLSGSDLIQIVCKECNVKESCPSILIEEYDDVERSQTAPAHPVKADETKNCISDQ